MVEKCDKIYKKLLEKREIYKKGVIFLEEYEYIEKIESLEKQIETLKECYKEITDFQNQQLKEAFDKIAELECELERKD